MGMGGMAANYPLILVAYMSPAEMAESAERISVQVSAISALSAGLVQQFMVNYMEIICEP